VIPGKNGYLVVVSLAIVLALITASECPSRLHFAGLLYGLTLWGWWAGVATALWHIGRSRPSVWNLTPQATLLHLLCASSLGLLHILLLRELGLTFLVPEYPPEFWRHLLNLNRFGMELLIYGFLLGIGGFLQSQLRAQREAVRTLELQKQLSVAHLRALQMQLEPHFLFNTLNAITTLVELGRQAQAAEMLGHLNVLLKTTLTRATPEKIALGQELEFVENYLAIEQVRFADRLRVTMDVDHAAVEGLVPCFLLQPIVENAIKHGIARCEDHGQVEVSATRTGDFLEIVVRNTGSAQPGRENTGYGIGLSNTRERLLHFYGNGYSMVTQPLATGGFQATMILPFEQATLAAYEPTATLAMGLV
jgi:signal transduction histidine kinase